jgi:hypothetical protein
MRKTTMFIFSVTLLSLTSCGGSSSNSATESAAPTSTTISQPDCSEASVEKAVGEPISGLACSGGWASLMPDSYAGSCGECANVWLYKWGEGTWNLKGFCSQYSPLIAGVSICSGQSGTYASPKEEGLMTEFPPREVACEIWAYNRDPEFVADTGCTPSS